MSEPFVGEIRMFAGNFAPRGWSYCDGQLLAVSSNDALFSLLGTYYGGDGTTTFGLPDLRGRVPVHAGSGPGLSPRSQGARGGVENVMLTEQQLPPHSHDQLASPTAGDRTSPSGNVIAGRLGDPTFVASAPDTDMAATAIGNSGANQAHTNLMPTTCVNFIIALFGIYPSRS